MWPAGWAVRASSGAAAAPDAGPWLCLHGERSLCYWTLLITDGTGQITGNRLIKFHVLWDLWPNIAPLGMVNLGLEWLQEGHFYLQILLGRKLFSGLVVLCILLVSECVLLVCVCFTESGSLPWGPQAPSWAGAVQLGTCLLVQELSDCFAL